MVPVCSVADGCWKSESPRGVQPRARGSSTLRGELGPGTSAPVLWNSPVAVKKWMVTFNYSGQHGDVAEKKNFEILAFFLVVVTLLRWLKLRSVLHTNPFHSSKRVSCPWRGHVNYR